MANREKHGISLQQAFLPFLPGGNLGSKNSHPLQKPTHVHPAQLIRSRALCIYLLHISLAHWFFHCEAESVLSSSYQDWRYCESVIFQISTWENSTEAWMYYFQFHKYMPLQSTESKQRLEPEILAAYLWFCLGYLFFSLAGIQTPNRPACR